MEEDLLVVLSPSALRGIGKTIRKNFTSEEVRAFLVLYREQLENAMYEAAKDFLKTKLGDA
jgi:hypothetical protein